MPQIGRFGLQLVDVEAGQCTIRKIDNSLHILNVSKETAARILDWQQGRGSKYIQDAVPELTAGEREMLITGIDDAEWDRIFPPDDSKQMGSEDDDDDGDEPAF